MPSIDLNADVGEGRGAGPDGDDAALIALVSSANIACGGHAGDEDSMRRCLVQCRLHGVSAGAHPAYPDRGGFGRRAMTLSSAALRDTLRAQILSLVDIADALGLRLSHVKPHGALYNHAAVDPPTAAVVAEVIVSVDPGLMLVGLAGSQLLEAGRVRGLRTLAEGFADRRYTRDGLLVPRVHPQAVIEQADEATLQVVDLVHGRGVQSIDGARVPLSVDTVCLHGDGAHALDFAKQLRLVLESGGVRIEAPVP